MTNMAQNRIGRHKILRQIATPSQKASILGLKSAVEIEGVFRFSLFFPRVRGVVYRKFELW